MSLFRWIANFRAHLRSRQSFTGRNARPKQRSVPLHMEALEDRCMPSAVTIIVNDKGGIYNGSAYAATAAIAGTNNILGPSLEGVGLSVSYFAGSSAGGTALPGAPIDAGTYTVTASFPGSADYGAASAAVTFAITPATPVLQVTDNGGTFNGSSFMANALVKGINGRFVTNLEGISPTLTYYAGSGGTGSPLPAAPVSAGVYTVVANFPGSTDYGAASSTATFNINPAAATVEVSDNGGIYDGSTFPASALVEGINGVFAVSLEGNRPTLTYYLSGNSTPLAGAPTSVGTYTDVATFLGSADYGSASSSAIFTIKAAPSAATVEVSDSGGIFDGAAFRANAMVEGGSVSFAASLEGVAPTLTYFAGSSGSGTPLSAAPVSVGTYTVVAVFAGSPDFTSASSLTTFTIGQATPTVEVSDSGGVFDGSAYSASAAVAGVGGVFGSSLEGESLKLAYFTGTSALSSAPSSAGTYTVVASFPGSTDYRGASSSATFSISPAPAVVQVSDGGGTFNGSIFPASLLVKAGSGVFATSLEGVSPTLTYYAGSSGAGTPLSSVPSSAGIYTAVATFKGSADYGSAASSATFSIGRATPTVSVSDQGGIFDGNGFAATALVAGINGSAGASLEGTRPTLTYYAGSSLLAAAPMSVGVYTVVASFAGTTDYGTASSSATFSIKPATPTVTVSDSGGTFDGSAFAATAIVAGISGSGTSLENVSPTLTYYTGSNAIGTPSSTAPSAAGTYTVVATFAGSTDYTSASSAPATFTIGQATPTVSVIDNGGVYNGQAFSATALVVGANDTSVLKLEGVSPGLTYHAGASANGPLLSGAPTGAGTYTVLASFPGSLDYQSAVSVPVTFTISRAAPSVEVSDGGTFNGSPLAAVAMIAGVNDGFATSLEGVTPTVTYYAGSSVGGTVLSSAPISAGVYTVMASFPGSTDYAAASSSASFTINSPVVKPVPIINVSDSGGSYTGQTFPANATIAGIGAAGPSLEGVNLAITYFAGSSVGGVGLTGAPVSVGTYTVLASFPGSVDYGSASSTATFTITKAMPIVTVHDGGTYTGAALFASDSVAGLSGQSGASLEGISPTLSYFTGSTATGPALAAAPIQAGTYTVVASFAGSTDYSAATSSLTFSILKAAPVLTVAGTGTYSGKAIPASDSIAGINGPASSSLEGVSPKLAYFSGNLALAGPPSQAGTYTVLASFAGSTDYSSAVTLATFTIARALPVVKVSDGGGVYTGQTFAASDSVAGLNGQASASLEGISPTVTYYAGSGSGGAVLAGAPVQAGTYTAVAVFGGSTDYAIASSSVTFVISKTTTSLKISDSGGIYNGSAFAATVMGLNGQAVTSLEGVSPTFTYYAGRSASGAPLSGAPVAAGNYTVVASFPGSQDFGSASATATFIIARATPTLKVIDSAGTYNGLDFPATVTVAGVNGVSGSSLEGVSPTLTYYAGSKAAGSPLLGPPVRPGTYTVVASFAVSADYSTATSSATFTIQQ
jgi:hypothetical protein